LNRAYTKFILTGKPYILLKLAQTLDGRIASSTGHSKWVTSEDSRTVAHKLRSQHDAILVGIGTVIMDDPFLTVRKVKGISPKRIVLDSQLRIPLDANVLSDESPNKTIIVTTNAASKEKIARIVERGSTVLVLDDDERGWVPQETLWKEFGGLGITSVMVEGGSSVHTECLKSRNADEIVMFFAPKLLGTGVDAIGDLGIRNMNAALELENLAIRRLHNDFMVSANLKKESGEV
jgi:diaminohydroxyphosphoribosylaminopyrimidine deaminase/5-amino-6-(5-phosphoribosylamino)uracil reductase